MKEKAGKLSFFTAEKGKNHQEKRSGIFVNPFKITKKKAKFGQYHTDIIYGYTNFI